MNGTKAGTSKYMAPEVYNNQPYGTSADIYSLGLVLYWLLNERRLPFMPLPPEKPKVGEEEICKQRRFSGEQLPEPFNGSKELKRIVLKACAYNSVDRYQDATEMLNDLKKLGDFAEEIPVIPTIPLVSNSFTKTEEKSVEVEAEVGKVVIKKEAKVEVVNEIADNISGESKHTIITKNFNLTNNKKLLIMCGMFSLVLVIIIVCCFFNHLTIS